MIIFDIKSSSNNINIAVFVSLQETASDQDKLLFRLHHIIPRTLQHANVPSSGALESPTPTNYPREIEFQMTWGKIAGIISSFKESEKLFT